MHSKKCFSAPHDFRKWSQNWILWFWNSCAEQALKWTGPKDPKRSQNYCCTKLRSICTHLWWLRHCTKCKKKIGQLAEGHAMSFVKVVRWRPWRFRKALMNTDDVFLIAQEPNSAASKPASVTITGQAPLLLTWSPTMPPAWLQRWMLRLSFQKWSNNTEYKSTWHALQPVFWWNVYSIVIPGIKSASAAAYALA